MAEIIVSNRILTACHPHRVTPGRVEIRKADIPGSWQSMKSYSLSTRTLKREPVIAFEFSADGTFNFASAVHRRWTRPPHVKSVKKHVPHISLTVAEQHSSSGHPACMATNFLVVKVLMVLVYS